VIQRLRLAVEIARLHEVELWFSGDYCEPLDPRTLETERICCSASARRRPRPLWPRRVRQLARSVDGEGSALLRAPGISASRLTVST
jgi:hypothetical protein